MKYSMQEMTIDELNGHWKTKDGAVHIWIDKDKQCVQLFENRQLVLDEPLTTSMYNQTCGKYPKL